MESKLTKYGLVTLIMAVALFLGACQSSQPHTASSDVKAASCEKCKTVWVQNPGGDPQKPWTITKGKAMTCPDCQSAVTNLFSTGKFEHTCKICGDDLKPCEVH